VVTQIQRIQYIVCSTKTHQGLYKSM